MGACCLNSELGIRLRQSAFQRRCRPPDPTAIIRDKRCGTRVSLMMNRLSGVIAVVVTCVLTGSSPVYAAGDVSAGRIVLRGAVKVNHKASRDDFTDILIVRNGRSIQAEPAMTLRPGDILATGRLQAVITFNGDEAEVIVGDNSQIDILNPSIRAVVGEVVVKIKETVTDALDATRELFRVETEFGPAAAEGTIFYVKVDTERIGIRVFEGRVRVDPVAEGAQPLRLQPGDITIMRRNEIPTKRSMSEDQINEVLSKVRRVERAISPYTGRRINHPPAPPLAPPAKEKLVREVQRLLLSLGYDPGPVDGKETQHTLAAVTEFKRDQYLPGLPRIDQQLLTALKRAKAELDRRRPLEPIDRGSVAGLETPPGGKVYGHGVMTLDGLIECIRLRQRIQALDSNLEQPRAAYKAEKAQLDALDRQLARSRQNLDRTDESAVKRYNAEVARRDSRIKRFNKQVEELNARQAPLRNLNETWMQRYNKQRYYIDDMVAARDTLRLDYVPGRACGR